MPEPASYDASRYNVVWTGLGSDFNDSMPIGNGDIGLNVWTEQNGDLVFLVGKTDAYTENGELVKLGRVRVTLTPNPFTSATSFTQTLNIARGEIDLSAKQPDGSVATVRLWVDANHPVAHIEVNSPAPTTLRAATEIWRTDPPRADPGDDLRELNGSPTKIIIDPDTVLPTERNEIACCHFNSRSTYPEVLQNQHLESLIGKYPDPLLHRTFGMVLKGPGLVSFDDQSLVSATPARSARLDLYTATTNTSSPQQWLASMEQIIAKTDDTRLEAAREAHQAWWNRFWNRSWIDVGGTPEADAVSQGYALQRWIVACGGRGSLPIKFNGSIFTVGQEPPPGNTAPVKMERSTPDYRRWGGNFWAQNERHIFWPMIAAGDYDLLSPYFQMYRSALPLEIDRTRLYWGHAGANYPETMYFWGTPSNTDFGWGNPSNVMTNTYIRNHIVGGLETVAMMLTQYDNTQDDDFAKKTMLPVAVAVTTYYDQHWPRSEDGKMHMDPAQAIETYQEAVNPTPDIAGLMNLLPRLLALPPDLTTTDERTMWTKLLADLPPLPLGTTGPNGKLADYGKEDPDGKPVILPAEVWGKPENVENPELYPVFPFRIYGVGKPDLDLPRNTYAARRFPMSNCWSQDGEEAALLGLADQAKAEVISNFTDYGTQRYKWFWKPGNDWTPDMDNGGAGMETLQLMIMQCDPGSRRIQLLPAWPSDWTGDFKLHAPYNTVVEGQISNGKLTHLTVTPAARRKDVVICEPSGP
jgi:alpha-L-fucosidase 2